MVFNGCAVLLCVYKSADRHRPSIGNGDAADMMAEVSRWEINVPTGLLLRANNYGDGCSAIVSEFSWSLSFSHASCYFVVSQPAMVCGKLHRAWLYVLSGIFLLPRFIAPVTVCEFSTQTATNRSLTRVVGHNHATH